MANDWRRGSFFLADTEQLLPIATPDASNDDGDDNDDEDSNDEFNIDFADSHNPHNDDVNPITKHDDDDMLSAKQQHHTQHNHDTNTVSTLENPFAQELANIMIRNFENLVKRGRLNQSFLDKFRHDPAEILRFFRQNRAVVGDQLNRRLDPKIRPTPRDLEIKGIVPNGYFSKGHEHAMSRKHRRKSTATQDLAAMIQLRPKPEEVVAKGIVERATMERYIELDDNKLDEELEYSIHDAVTLRPKTTTKTQSHSVVNDERDDQANYNAAEDEEAMTTPTATAQQDPQDAQTWEISILNTLLFKTIAEALRKSTTDTQKQEAVILSQMEEMNTEMKQLRNALDKYFLDDEPDVLQFKKEEEQIRGKFHGIQQKLLAISTKQNNIHQKLRILYSVERKMIDLQNVYDKQLGMLRKHEENVLNDLREQKVRCTRAIKVRAAEKSRSNWAMAKLDHTMKVASSHQLDEAFAQQLNGFLHTLRAVSEHQNRIVGDFCYAIESLESQLLSIRHEMGKVRTMTFKKIYDLHKQVEIAEALELGNRRYSVATATEIERERRHHATKIQRQLSTLSNEIRMFNHVAHQKRLREIIDVQYVMSDGKLKAFFSVFAQCFAQTLCDIDLCYQHLDCFVESSSSNVSRSQSDDDDDEEGDGGDDDGDGDERRRRQKAVAASSSAAQQLEHENKVKLRQLSMEFYGVNNVLLKITLNDSRDASTKIEHDLTLVEKIVHCMKFIQICKNAFLYELQKDYYQRNELYGNDDVIDFESMKNLRFKLETSRLNEIVLIIARKLCMDNHMLYDLDMTSDDQIAVLAQNRVQSIFTAIVRAQDLSKIFVRKPLSAMDVASAVLKHVFAIENREQNESYSH